MVTDHAHTNTENLYTGDETGRAAQQHTTSPLLAAPGHSPATSSNPYELVTMEGAGLFEAQVSNVPPRGSGTNTEAPEAGSIDDDDDTLGPVYSQVDKKKTKPKPDTEEPGLMYSQVDRSKKTKHKPDFDEGAVYSQVSYPPRSQGNTLDGQDADILENDIYSSV